MKKETEGPTHKVTNINEISKNPYTIAKTACEFDSDEQSFWFSHHWEDVTCIECLAAKSQMSFEVNK